MAAVLAEVSVGLDWIFEDEDDLGLVTKPEERLLKDVVLAAAASGGADWDPEAEDAPEVVVERPELELGVYAQAVPLPDASARSTRSLFMVPIDQVRLKSIVNLALE